MINILFTIKDNSKTYKPVNFLLKKEKVEGRDSPKIPLLFFSGGD